MQSSVADVLLEQRVTFTRFVVEEFTQKKMAEGATGEFMSLLTDIASACKFIAMLVNKGPKLGVLGAASTQNVQGEEQKTLDVLSNDVFINHNSWGGRCAGMVTEEIEEWVPIPKQYQKGKYLLCFDPLDGSSNVAVNISVGTIFSILKIPDHLDKDQDEDLTPAMFLQPGTEQVGAGYCLYGPQTTLVLTTGNGVNGFVLDLDLGEFILSFPNMSVPHACAEYSINHANRRHWDPPVRRYIEELEQGKEGPRKKDFSMRYVGSMVADVHRILTRGGVFMYPADAKMRKANVLGRLRLLYETHPLSLVMEQAGGRAIRGVDEALKYTPVGIHERGPIMMGSKDEIDLLQKYHLDAEIPPGVSV